MGRFAAVVAGMVLAATVGSCSKDAPGVRVIDGTSRPGSSAPGDGVAPPESAAPREPNSPKPSASLEMDAPALEAEARSRNVVLDRQLMSLSGLESALGGQRVADDAYAAVVSAMSDVSKSWQVPPDFGVVAGLRRAVVPDQTAAGILTASLPTLLLGAQGLVTLTDGPSGAIRHPRRRFFRQDVGKHWRRSVRRLARRERGRIERHR